MPTSTVFAEVLDAALAKLRAKAVPVFTFAFYHDHESAVVSVCVDTAENSGRKVAAVNKYNIRHFQKAVSEGDLNSASLWQANIGRNLSLGDMALVNLAKPTWRGRSGWPVLPFNGAGSDGRAEPGGMLAPEPERLIFSCSGPESEVAYVWSLPLDA